MSNNILVIQLLSDDLALQELTNKLSVIAATFAATYDTLDRALHARNYAVIMVDLVDTKQGNSSCALADMVRYLSNVQPTAKIIGMSSIPTWYQA
ncbi:MAG TPA: hypothetical protein P5121_27435, partial [Caldilineaceae bacterium]|nr:hypothetical protein [Caldilineaceae bacterium]